MRFAVIAFNQSSTTGSPIPGRSAQQYYRRLVLQFYHYHSAAFGRQNREDGETRYVRQYVLFIGIFHADAKAQTSQQPVPFAIIRRFAVSGMPVLFTWRSWV